ncbi:DNA-binding protein [Moraxellaceae bacterium AER2_44_116]|nr:DNA-binding protein [Moraxellaceae bacterium]TQC99745.1 DNA-binding protein [Moraxellaceae bacterium AER2_44_116]
MNKAELEILAEIRILEAEALLAANQFNGAYYLAGYALECAFKACIAKKVNQYDFPNKKLAIDSYSHDLALLVGVAGLQQELLKKLKVDKSFALNWAVAKDWSEQARYDSNIGQAKANDLYSAITDKDNGVLSWLKTFW